MRAIENGTDAISLNAFMRIYCFASDMVSISLFFQMPMSSLLFTPHSAQQNNRKEVQKMNYTQTNRKTLSEIIHFMTQKKRNIPKKLHKVAKCTVYVTEGVVVCGFHWVAIQNCVTINALLRTKSAHMR